ncbi:hypothetical protein ABPG75_013047 [Micractinium tetrahymenae]
MGKRENNDLGAANTTASVQVLGVGSDTGATVPSALLFFDRQRYLFNAGEGFQRFCVEHRVKIGKVSGVLATRTTTEATGGLPGMLLSMADTSCGGLLAGHAGMSVFGPPGLSTLVNAFRTFVNVRDIGLKVHEFGAGSDGAAPAPVVANELVAITPVVLSAAGAPPGGQAGSAATAGEGGEPSAKRPRLEGGGQGQQGGGMDIASVAVESPAACYVCELPDVPGKFLPQKAASLGVPRGPLFGKLVKGEEVTAANGQVVRPADVMEPATPGPVVLVVDCPSETFMPALTSSPQLLECTSGGKRDKVAVVVHLSPLEVVRLPAYRDWLASFGPGATHLLVAESLSSPAPVMRKSAVLQAKLNALDPALFPLCDASATGAAGAAQLPANCVVGANMLRYHLRPVAKKGIDTADCPAPVDAAAEHAELREQKPEVLEALAAAGAPAEGEQLPACIAAGRREEFEVTFLGTGAAVPSKYRNVTGIHVNLFGHGGMLMDCGEGSYGQLRRRFGSAAADDLIRRLSLVWISHIHADHHVGLPAVLAARTRLLGPDCPPLLVLGPRPLRRALQGYAQLEPMRFRFVEASATAAPPPEGAPTPPAVPPEARAAIDAAVAGMGLSRFESVLVAHCAHAYGLVLERAADEGGAGGWKLVFSGDTRPCARLVEAAKGATLLIHEATFEDSLADEAVAKKHCTTSEAVEAGAQAGAFRTLLTHFSQRYPKIPVVDQNFQGTVGIAFDLMSVNLADVPSLPRVVPALKLLFKEEEGDEDEPQPQMLS